MKKVFFCLTVLIFFFCNCSPTEQGIKFLSLSDTDFNSAAIGISKGIISDSIKRNLDSCMGYSFAANALFIRTKDTFGLGCIVNRKTLQVVRNLNPGVLSKSEFSSVFTFVTSPCYEKRTINIPVDLFLRNHVNLKLPGVNENINKELNDDVAASENTEVETGSWVYAGLSDGLGNILDTAKDPLKTAYKKYLLNPDNMILVRSGIITEITFYINTQKPISNSLKAVLVQKPSQVSDSSNLKIRLFYIDDTRFELTFTGFFQIMGQFMKAELH